MNTYRYSAKDEKGRVLRGTLAAKDEADLQDRLKQEGRYLLFAKLKEEKRRGRPLGAESIADFSRNIGKLLGAGVPLVRALKIISEDDAIGERERAAYAGLLKSLRTGMSLSEAMHEQEEVFPQLFINMYKSAEAAGTLERTAAQMAVHYDQEYRLNQKIKSAMTYPKILMVLILAVVLVIMGYVVPRFQGLFAQMEELPVSTRILLGMSSFVKDHWDVLLIICIILFALGKILLALFPVRYQMDRLKVYMPVTGKLMRVIYTARFARTLASLYNAGIPIIPCLHIAGDTIDNTFIQRQFEEVIADVQKGRSLSQAMEQVQGFTNKLVSSILVGEETGSLDSMLLSIADQLEYDAQVAVGKLVSLVEPVMILVMAVIVGFIMISIIQPIYGSYQAISGYGQ